MLCVCWLVCFVLLFSVIMVCVGFAVWLTWDLPRLVYGVVLVFLSASVCAFTGVWVWLACGFVI